ncbi:tyrosine-type recombinase/integrase [Bremerella sp. P1]|uniref:tyrosine-type recombinase/integrase n=1 Tax=Bremerella sp. P1 TaxID=3026424 RepID=UPI002368D1FC|nr:site-specific integrase [Bremerella sp. P1]WDI41070.1 site-specific integrase [Bremerella sp. P1]
MPKPTKNPKIKKDFFEWSINERNDGCLQATTYVAGVGRIRRSLGTKDWDKALEDLTELDRHEAEEHGLAPKFEERHRSGEVTIEDGWQAFLDDRDRGQVQGGVSPTTLKRYRAVRAHHEAFAKKKGITEWQQFGKQEFVAFGKEREKVAEPRTVFFELNLVKSVNLWLVHEEMLPEQLRLRVKLPKPKGTSTYCYRQQEISAMVRQCEAAQELEWLRLVILGLTYTGMRISELASLRWSDIDFDSNHIHVVDERSRSRKKTTGPVRTTKGKRSRVIPMHPELKEVLRPLQEQAGGYVFKAQKGGQLRPRVVLEVFIREVIKPLSSTFPTPENEIGFHNGRLHSFRHAFCSHALGGGASVGEVQDWLGHADSKMVEHYRHLRDDQAQQRMNSLSFMAEDSVSSVS